MARVPLYKAAETEMIRRIETGDWEVGKRLPNEFELADDFGVSQGTMRRALITLEGMGLLTRKPGRGTIVAAQAPVATAGVSDAVGFDRLVDSIGDPFGFEVFRARASTRRAEAVEETLFGSKRVAILERTLKLDDARVALDTIAVPEHVLAEIPEDAPVDLAEALTAQGLSVGSLQDRVAAELTSMSDSVALSVDRHTALLRLTRVAYDTRNTAIARQVLRIVADGIGYDMTLRA